MLKPKRLWSRHLYCGRIIAALADGTLVLCIRKHRHAARNCFNPIFGPPASHLPKLEGGMNKVSCVTVEGHGRDLGGKAAGCVTENRHSTHSMPVSGVANPQRNLASEYQFSHAGIQLVIRPRRKDNPQMALGKNVFSLSVGLGEKHDRTSALLQTQSGQESPLCAALEVSANG